MATFYWEGSGGDISYAADWYVVGSDGYLYPTSVAPGTADLAIVENAFSLETISGTGFAQDFIIDMPLTITGTVDAQYTDVGYGQAGTVFIGPGGWTETGYLTVGVDSLGTLYITSGATLADEQDIYLGAASGGKGGLIITSGTLTTNGTFDAIGAAAQASGYVLISGSLSAWDAAEPVVIAIAAGATGSLEVGGGGFLNAMAGVIVGEDGNGELIVDDGGSLAIAHSGTAPGLVIGADSDSQGTLIMGFGTITTEGGQIVVGDAGSGMVTSQGTIEASAANYAPGTPALVLGAMPGGTGDCTLGVLGLVDGAVALGPGGFGSMVVQGRLSAGGTNDGGTGLVLTNGTLTISGSVTVSDNADAGGTSAILLEGNGTLQSGGKLTIEPDAALICTSGTVTGDIVDDGTIEAGSAIPAVGFRTIFEGNITGTGIIFVSGSYGATLESPLVSATVQFNTSTESNLGLSSTHELSKPIQGFGTNAGIDFANLKGITERTSYRPGLTDLSFSDGGVITLAGHFRIGIRINSIGNANIYDIPCFTSGTRIATADGLTAVEQLRTGDSVILADGGRGRVVWIGHRSVDCTDHPRPWDVHPVRIRAGAFGAGLPVRDLMLSPDHAVFTDGVLIPVRYLINGATIVQEQTGRVVYWHVELDRHDVLLAEGLPCESYLDTGNRSAFVNGGAAVQWHPDFALRAWQAQGCAPLVREGAELEAARSWLLDCAGNLGHTLTGDPDLTVLAGGRALRPDFDGRCFGLRLPPGTQTIHLASRVWTPAHTRPDETDTRLLGVAIARLWIGGRQVSLDSPGLSDGWHPPEPEWRWTNGSATLAVAGAPSLAFELAMTGTYWHDSRFAAASAANAPVVRRAS